MRKLTIGKTTITDQSKPYIISELGHNHQGNLDVCKKMVYASKAMGADAVKLQRIIARDYFTKTFFASPYNSENAFAPTYGEHREYLTLPDEAFSEISELAHYLGMDFICTPFDDNSIDFLAPLVDAFKISSFHNQDKPFIDHVKRKDKPIIASTGYCDMEDVRYLNAMLEGAEYALLQCTSVYPVRNPADLRLGVILKYRAEFPDVIVGYSHHYHAPLATAVAVAFGARIIEAHFTLNRTSKGTDHNFSVEPDGLRWVVNNCNDALKMVGSIKEKMRDEVAPITKMSRSVYPSRAIKAGDELHPKDIRFCAPGGGVRPGIEIQGKISLSDLSTATPINEEDLQ